MERREIDAARGALLGLAVGDAFGTTLEFSRPVAPPFPRLATGPHTDITGGGPFGLLPGQVTDDTQMACCLATSLREHGGFRAADVAKRYVAWRDEAFDIGSQTSAALALLHRGAPPEEAGRAVWLAEGKTPAGNGSLMRTAPIGVFFASNPEALRLAALGDAALTHYDPRCSLAGAAFNAALAQAILGARAPSDLLSAADAELAPAATAMIAAHPEDSPEIDAAEAALREDLAAARREDPAVHQPSLDLHTTQGFVRVAFRLAFWELLHAPSFEAALVDVVNRGGDADTNGAITGALLGGFHGANAIPAHWERAVLDALQDLPPSPLRDDYHPRRLFG